MESPELSISVGELIGVSRITMRGCMDGWHDQALAGILGAFRDEGTVSLVMDLAGLTFAGAEGATSMINALRTVGPGMCVHVVASGQVKNLLDLAKLGACVRLYSSTDEIAEYLSPSDEFLTSRWLAAGTEDQELPLAA